MTHKSRGVLRAYLKQILHQLLRNGTCSSRVAMSNEIFGSSEYTFKVDAEVMVEPLIFCINQSLYQNGRYIFIFYRRTVFRVIFAYQFSVGTVYFRCHMLYRCFHIKHAGRFTEQP